MSSGPWWSVRTLARGFAFFSLETFSSSSDSLPSLTGSFCSFGISDTSLPKPEAHLGISASDRAITSSLSLLAILPIILVILLSHLCFGAGLVRSLNTTLRNEDNPFLPPLGGLGGRCHFDLFEWHETFVRGATSGGFGPRRRG